MHKKYRPYFPQAVAKRNFVRWEDYIGTRKYCLEFVVYPVLNNHITSRIESNIWRWRKNYLFPLKNLTVKKVIFIISLLKINRPGITAGGGILGKATGVNQIKIKNKMTVDVGPPDV